MSEILPHPMPSPAPTSLRVGLAVCLTVVWALVCAWWLGPKATIGECLVPVIGGLLTVAGFWIAYGWARDVWDATGFDEGASFQSNLSWLWSIVLVFVLIGLAIAWQACVAEPLRKLRRWDRERRGDISEAEFQDRVKALRHEQSRTRF